MSFLYLENFDDGAWDQAAINYANVTPSGTYGKVGNGIRLGDTPGAYIRVPNGGGPRIIIGFHLKVVDALASTTQPLTYHGGNYQSRLVYDSTNERVGFGYPINSVSFGYYYTDLGSVKTDQWHYIEFDVLSNTGSAGTIKIAVDGDLQVNVSSIDWYGNTISECRLGGTGSSDCNDFYVDDIYTADSTGGVNDTVPLGPLEVTTLLPDGNGNSSDLTGSDGNSTDNYLLVDENPPNDGTDYVGSGTEGDQDTYTMDDLSGTPTVIGAVVRMNAAKTDTGAKYMRPVCRVSSIDYTGASKALSETYDAHDIAFDENPNTSTAWTYTTLNGAEFGAEVRDS